MLWDSRWDQKPSFWVLLNADPGVMQGGGTVPGWWYPTSVSLQPTLEQCGEEGWCWGGGTQPLLPSSRCRSDGRRRDDTTVVVPNLHVPPADAGTWEMGIGTLALSGYLALWGCPLPCQGVRGEQCAGDGQLPLGWLSQRDPRLQPSGVTAPERRDLSRGEVMGQTWRVPAGRNRTEGSASWGRRIERLGWWGRKASPLIRDGALQVFWALFPRPLFPRGTVPVGGKPWVGRCRRQ